MSGAITAIVKRLVRRIVYDYRLNWIYASDGAEDALPVPDAVDVIRLDDAGLRHIDASPDTQFRKALGYDRLGAIGYMLSRGGVPLSVAHFVGLALYDSAAIWPLGIDEVALLNIVTAEAARGRGYAPMLISNAARAILATQFTRAIAFIWWNHRASLRAFDRAGWRCVGFSVQLIDKKGAIRSLHLSVPYRRPRKTTLPASSARSPTPHAPPHP